MNEDNLRKLVNIPIDQTNPLTFKRESNENIDNKLLTVGQIILETKMDDTFKAKLTGSKKKGRSFAQATNQ